MAAHYKVSKPRFKDKEKKHIFTGECFICEKVGHKARDCRNKDKKMSKRVSNAQTNNKAATIMNTEQDPPHGKYRPQSSKEETFVLRVSEWDPRGVQHQGMLVDSGASAHIMTDERTFVKFDETFQPKNHVMQLADGTQTKGREMRRSS